jgi:hypothetical protein
MLNTRHLLVLGIAGVFGLGAASRSIAAPVIGSGAAVKAAAAGDTINVQWRRWGGGWRGGWGGGWGGGWRRGWGWGPGLGVGPGWGVGGGYGYCGPYGACGGYAAPVVAVVPAPVVVVPAVPYYGGGWQGGWGGW